MRILAAHAIRHVRYCRTFARHQSTSHGTTNHAYNQADTRSRLVDFTKSFATSEVAHAQPDALSDGSLTRSSNDAPTESPESSTASISTQNPITSTDLNRLLAHASDASKGSTALIDAILSVHPAPNTATYHAALRALAVHPSPFLLAHILEQMRNHWIPLTDSAHHDVAVCLIRNGQIEEGLEYLENMEHEGVKVKGWLYDMLLYALIQRNELDDALRLVHHRVRTGTGGDIEPLAYYLLFDAACVRLHHPSLSFIWARQVFANHERVKPSAGHCLAVLRAAARHGDTDLSQSVVELLNKRGVVLGTPHYELLMDAYITKADLVVKAAPHDPTGTEGRMSPKAEAGRQGLKLLERGVRVLGAMATAGLHVSRASTRTLLQSLTDDARRIDVVHRTLEAMKKNGTDVPTAALDTLIEANVRFAVTSAPVDTHTARQWLERAMRLYRGVRSLCDAGPGIHTFNILLNGCAEVGDAKATAMFLASEMVGMRMRPNAVTYDRLVLVCLRGGAATATATADSNPRSNRSRSIADQDEDDDDDDDEEAEENFNNTPPEPAYEDAFRYLAEMEQKGWIPRAGTLRELVEACAKNRDRRAWALLGKMREAGFETAEVTSWVRAKWEEV